MPQIKTRPIEAIFNKTLVLLKEDPWHVFDYWFEPGVDFLYYEKNEDLEWVIRQIVTNWDNYKHIPENAYKKAMELYTSERLYRDIEKGQSEFKFK
jgi:spore maturation protein CgeB